MFGFHENGIGKTSFSDGVKIGKFDGHHVMKTVSYCKNCNARTVTISEMEIVDKLNVLKRKQLVQTKKDEVITYLKATTKSITMIAALTGVSESTIRRIEKELTPKVDLKNTQ